MEAPSDTRPESRPDSRKDRRREAILEVAAEVFAEEGFQAASMSSIAARLGGSKATLYNYFDSKDALFEAHIRGSCGKVAGDILDLAEDEPVPETLQKLGEGYLDHILSDWAVRTYQIVVAEARRSPELARVFFEAGPRVGHDRLRRYLELAVARGELAVEDCGEAAWQFLTLCRTHHMESVLSLAPKPSPAEIRKQVDNAVRIFMARYGT